MLTLVSGATFTRAEAQSEANVPDPDVAGAQADEVQAEAKALFQAGRIAYDSGRYEDALERFRDAHDLTDLPPLLYNVALAADRARYDEIALEYYERFLEEAAPDELTKSKVEARVAGLRRALERRRSSEAEAAEVPTPEEAARDAMTVEEERPGIVLAAGDGEKDEGGLSGWAWAGIGGGVAVAVAAVVTAVLLTRGGDEVVPGDHGVVVTTLGAR